MAARSPRKLFANPFVITTTLATACYTAPPPTQPTQQPTQQSSQTEPPPGGETIVANPPRPAPQPAPAPAVAYEQRWQLMKNGTTCRAMVNVECPRPKKDGQPAPTCNPPPPMKYECPANWDGSSPLAVVQLAGSTECTLEAAPIKCPPNTMCNPPPPQKVACPKY